MEKAPVKVRVAGTLLFLVLVTIPVKYALFLVSPLPPVAIPVVAYYPSLSLATILLITYARFLTSLPPVTISLINYPLRILLYRPYAAYAYFLLFLALIASMSNPGLNIPYLLIPMLSLRPLTRSR